MPMRKVQVVETFEWKGRDKQRLLVDAPDWVHSRIKYGRGPCSGMKPGEFWFAHTPTYMEKLYDGDKLVLREDGSTEVWSYV